MEGRGEGGDEILYPVMKSGGGGAIRESPLSCSSPSMRRRCG